MTTTMAPETPAQLATRVGVHLSTVRRWLTVGVVAGRKRVRLPATRVGRRWRITAEAWEAFTASCNPTATPIPESPTKRAARLAAEKAETLAILNG